MIEPDTSTWFAGDLDDPWVADIADALPRGSRRFSCPGELPETWPAGLGPRVLVLHRANLTATDAQRLARLRARGASPPRVILCAGQYVRYHQWERWGPLVDVVLPEATAAETVARQLLGADARWRPSGHRTPLAIVGGDSELRSALSDACAEAGYLARASESWDEVPPGTIAVAVVPLLQDGWAHDLARPARSRPVVALLGFADRPTVTEARNRGVAACLDLPCDLPDLFYVLDRLSAIRPEPAHAVPPPPAGLRHPRPFVAESRRPA